MVLYWRYSGSENMVLQKILRQNKTMLNEDMTKDILYFDNLKYSFIIAFLKLG